MSKQDRVAPRTAEDIERKTNFKQTFAQFAGLISDAERAAMEAEAAAKAASDAVKNLNNELDQDEIFNRLTNNGEVQGIYRADDGQVYINASYLVTGILRSKNGDTFYLDLDNGVLKGKFQELSISGKTVDTIAQEKANTAESNAKTYANTAANNAVSSQTQTDIFNKLTNNGSLQGLYMKDNDIFINASYIKSGKIVSEGQTYLRPTYDDCIYMLRSAVFPDNYPAKDFFDLNGDGVFDKNDALFALDVFYGLRDISECKTLQKSTVTVTIEPSNPLETVKISGVNMWGSEVVVVLGANCTKIPVISGSCSIGGQLTVKEYATIQNLALSVGGAPKALSWKANGDGTHTLIGTD